MFMGETELAELIQLLRLSQFVVCQQALHYNEQHLSIQMKSFRGKEDYSHGF